MFTVRVRVCLLLAVCAQSPRPPHSLTLAATTLSLYARTRALQLATKPPAMAMRERKVACCTEDVLGRSFRGIECTCFMSNVCVAHQL
jgi:hypothetical protein